MKFFVLFLLAVFTCKFSMAQSAGLAHITAKIKDESGKGVDGATVSLLNAKDTSLVKINLSEKDGTVSFDNIY